MMSQETFLGTFFACVTAIMDRGVTTVDEERLFKCQEGPVTVNVHRHIWHTGKTNSNASRISRVILIFSYNLYKMSRNFFLMRDAQ